MSEYNIHNRKQQYKCNNRHDNLDSYYSCHCEALIKYSNITFLLGTISLLVGSVAMMHSRLVITFNNEVAAWIFVCFCILLLFLLFLIEFMIPVSTKVGNATQSELQNEMSFIKYGVKDYLEFKRQHAVKLKQLDEKFSLNKSSTRYSSAFPIKSIIKIKENQSKEAILATTPLKKSKLEKGNQDEDEYSANAEEIMNQIEDEVVNEYGIDQVELQDMSENEKKDASPKSKIKFESSDESSHKHGKEEENINDVPIQRNSSFKKKNQASKINIFQ